MSDKLYCRYNPHIDSYVHIDWSKRELQYVYPYLYHTDDKTPCVYNTLLLRERENDGQEREQESIRSVVAIETGPHDDLLNDTR